jgi:hypothetical protein
LSEMQKDLCKAADTTIDECAIFPTYARLSTQVSNTDASLPPVLRTNTSHL